jgi:Ran GTPase-activating protein (RanGAP) involved in mRNA processing and transport
VALADALKTNSTLTSLRLGGNWINDGGAVALAEALKTNSTLTSLNLNHNGINKDGANRFLFLRSIAPELE